MGTEMRTRYLPSLTNWEAEEYLKRNDVIFIPVGTVEMHGALPMNCEYIFAEALALKAAEECDGLVLPNLTYFAPGGTDIGRGTVYMSITEGYSYLRVLAHSLLKQGFRRQVYITAHGPAYQTIIPMVFQFLDEEKVPIYHADVLRLFKDTGFDLGSKMEVFDEMIYGAYKILGRLSEVPVGLCENPQVMINPGSDLSHCMPEGILSDLYSLKGGGYYTSWKYGNVHEHENIVRVRSQEELMEAAAVGEAKIDEFVAAADFHRRLESLKKLDEFHQKEVIPRYGEWAFHDVTRG